MSRDKDALLDMLEMIDLIQNHGPKDERSLKEDVVRQGGDASVAPDHRRGCEQGLAWPEGDASRGGVAGDHRDA